MLFAINAEDFVKEFKSIIQIVPVHTTFPILSNIRIKIENGKLNIFATDLDTSLIYNTNLCKTEENETIVVPAKTLFSIMGEIKGETIFRKEESRVKIEYDKGYFYAQAELRKGFRTDFSISDNRGKDNRRHPHAEDHSQGSHCRDRSRGKAVVFSLDRTHNRVGIGR